MHTSSYENMRNFVNKYLSKYRNMPLKILDLGSQDINGTYRGLFADKLWQYTGADLCSGANVDIVIKNPYRWREIKSGSYDVVISGQTLEHVEYFWLTIREIKHALKPRGICCLIAPSAGFEHKYPVDCWRFYTDGMKALARYAGLDIIETYTCRESTVCGEENIWQDTVAVCSKPGNITLQQKIKQILKHDG